MSEDIVHDPVSHEVPIEGDDAVVRIPIRSELLIVAAILILIFGGGALLSNKPPLERKESQVISTLPALEADEIKEPEVFVDPFLDISVVATSAFVFDTKTQRVLFQKNPDEQLPLASLTKLMTAALTYEVLENNDAVPITLDALRQDGYGLSENEVYEAETLLDLVLLTSSNEGAYALAAAAGAQLADGGSADTFVKAMNIKAEELNLTQTYYRNPTGLDISRDEAGAYSSARDTAFLMEHILMSYPQVLEKTADLYSYVENQAGSARTAYNTNQYVDEIPGIISSKTGFTDLAGGNLVVAFNAAVDRPIIVVVLGSTRSQRFTDTLALVAAAQDAVQ